MNNEPLCFVPFRQVFVKTDNNYRICCNIDTRVEHKAESLVSWWKGSELNEFRNKLKTDSLPSECSKCVLAELDGAHSFRKAVNAASKHSDFYLGKLPDRYQIMFSNLCNLACWTCNENSSSIIESDKKKAGLLPVTFQSNDASESWDATCKSILKSYEQHDTILLSILGGEPTINTTLLDFLEEVVRLGLASRTILEVTTNGHTLYPRFLTALQNKWKYITIFCSVDAIGKKASWVRYGSDWEKISRNMLEYKKVANYFEVHSTVSILTARDVPALYDFCKDNDYIVKFYPVTSPVMFAPSAWSGDPILFGNKQDYADRGLDNLYDTYGSNVTADTKSMLANYIKPLQEIRSVKLLDVDPLLYNCIFN